MPKEYDVSAFGLSSIVGSDTLVMAPVQIHSFIIALFISTVAPFGGFFASGFKRAFKIKDFGDVIPGHGGFTDRMDCVIITGMFIYIYCSMIIFKKPPNVENLINQIIQLSEEERSHLLSEVAKSLT